MTFHPDCVFCDEDKIVSPVEILCGADGSCHRVFEPLNPVVPGHLLVVPHCHVQDATEEPLVTAMAAGVAARVAQRYKAANIITSIGAPATQSIMHLHLHVVPREEKDYLYLPWDGPKIEVGKNERGGVCRVWYKGMLVFNGRDYSEEVMNMALRKHGEGEVIPETEQQKTAAKDGDGMSKEAAEELRAENEEADRVE